MAGAPRPVSHRPSISAHRVLAGGRTALLLRPDAEVDWWCAPDLDSPPLCWSLLDAGGGRASFPGVRYASGSDAPAGPTARTVLVSGCGRVEVRDGLLERSGHHPALVRLVRGCDGDLDLVHELSVGGFGADRCRWELGVVARAGTGAQQVSVHGGQHVAAAGVLRSRLVAPRGRWTALVIGVGDQPPCPDADELAAMLDRAEAEHGAWLRGCRLPARHRQRAVDALAVLRACTYDPTGATVAALTTSLPEAPGHDRQYDYRFSWLRDASLAVSVVSLLGQRGDAARYLRFVHRVTGGRVVPSGPVIDIRGRTVPDEREVPGVAGWAGSTPVRVGNGAAGQVQYDALGMLTEAVSVHVQTGGPLDGTTWQMVRDLADRVAAEDPAVPQPSHGIWEKRTAGPFVDGDIGRWLVLDRAVALGRWYRPWRSRRAWTTARDTIAARVRGAITPDGLLPQSYRQDPPVPDASALLAVIFGLLDPGGEQARRVVRRTLDALEAYPFLYRYPPDGSDDFSGTEGAFVPVSFWAVTAQALTGDLRGALARMDDLCAALPRLLSEEVDPVEGTALGNVPQVWSHVELARALYVLDAAERRARWGTAGLWAWRLGRYARLRWGP